MALSQLNRITYQHENAKKMLQQNSTSQNPAFTITDDKAPIFYFQGSPPLSSDALSKKWPTRPRCGAIKAESF